MIVHMMPRGDSGEVPCCGKTVVEISSAGDRLTLGTVDPVTCPDAKD